VISSDGVTGDWLRLGTLVRVPGFKELRCPRVTDKPCILTGTNLFLATQVGPTPDMVNAAEVAPDFTGTQLIVPHPPANGLLYLKLRDDPATVQTLALPVLPGGPPVTAAKTQPPPAAQPTSQPGGEPMAPPAAEPTAPPSKSTPPATPPTVAPEKAGP
jgi:hypothetical protein